MRRWRAEVALGGQGNVSKRREEESSDAGCKGVGRYAGRESEGGGADREGAGHGATSRKDGRMMKTEIDGTEDHSTLWLGLLRRR